MRGLCSTSRLTMDALEMLVDEVALEGLDGITIPTLWIRLEHRVPKFPLRMDPATKDLLWRALVCNRDMDFYELPQERPPVVFFDRFAEVDPETGVQELQTLTPSVESRDVYPVSVIHQDKNGIQGSCLFFKERQSITDLIRAKDLKPSYTLEDAFKRWEHKLVVVASQEVRYRSLIGLDGDPELKLNDYSYCILERLGRARWQGELQRDLHSRAFKTDAGKMHYMRRSLDKHGLITHQSHVIRQPTGLQQYSILLLLKRFHMDRRNKYDILMEKTSKLLSTCPGNTGVMINLRDQLQLNEGTFKRVYQYMMAAKLVKIVSVPLQKLNPDAGPCKTKKGKDIMVRCLKLLKNSEKNEDDDDEDNNEEDSSREPPQSESRVMERDTVTNAYEIVISSGTKGISQSALRGRMNVGKLEGRMICRLLERTHMIKGFMEDEGRQRTTKYISKIFVEQSKLNQQFAKEKARSEQLMTGAAAELGQTDVDSSADRSQLHSGLDFQDPGKGTPQQQQMHETKSLKPSDKVQKEDLSKKNKFKQPKLNADRHSTPIKGKGLPSFTIAEEAVERLHSESIGVMQEETSFGMDGSDQMMTVSSFNTSTDSEAIVTVVEEVVSHKGVRPPKTPGTVRVEKPHQTYRLLKRKNLIIETVRNLKVIESLYTLQKMIMDEEKQDGVSTKCCKKSILRLLSSLAREGVLKLFRTTVIQDGISKKVEFVVHPSITPDDPLVRSAIEQIRFRISSSTAALRIKAAQATQEPVMDKGAQGVEKNANIEKGLGSASPKNQRSKTDEMMGVQQLKGFKPSIVPGLGRSLGFLPKIPRLKVVHSFLWYLIYGHALRRGPGRSKDTEEDGSEPAHSGEGSHKASQDKMFHQEAASNSVPKENTFLDAKVAEFETQRVYVDELTWRRYIPPTPLHREFGYGWALTSDILLSLPLSIFVQIIQVSYKVDDLETYLNDPLKQHYLIRFLPGQMKKQLLYKRRYIFGFYESMQRLCYMGLLQFGPIEKFQDKDQVFIYLKTKATIVDTTTCEPHYNLAMSSRPFEHRFYAFNTTQDVENYWFDLQCVCLNTPLGVVRFPRTKSSSGQGDEEEEEAKLPPPAEPERPEQRYARLAYALRGSREVSDNGVTPGDGQGAGGLDSCFFAHLKRNWIWTSYLLSKPKKTDSTFSPTLRLKNLLKKHPFPISMCGAGKVSSIRDSTLLPVVEEDIQITTEPSDRNSRVVGGKKQKRKRLKAVAKPPKKKRKVGNPVKKQTRFPFHDEADRSALERMTRLRVIWTVQEDSLLMLCRVASHFLNRKIKKPFVPWQVVRDLLHAQFEESLDKTSLSVGRRSRYIMKNPQTNLNFKICLAEVYQDKDLIENFQNRKNNYDNPEVCASEFKEFVAVLRQKFSSVSDDRGLCIPDTKEELFRRFKVYAIGENAEESRTDILASLEDIHSLVLNNLIQSTLVLSNSQMKSCLSFQTFHVYNRYKQTVLETAFLKCQKRGLVNRRRVSKSFGPKKSRGLPFLPMSYQLSQTYFRCFSWRFPTTTCTEAFEFLETLKDAGREDRPNIFLFQDQEEEQLSADPDSVLFSLDSTGGACVASLSLMMMGLLSVELSIPEHIVVVDSTLVDNEVVKSISKDATEEDDDEEDADEADGRKKIEVKARQASHTNYLLMRGYCVPGIVSLRNLNTNDNIVVNSCAMRLKLRKSPSHQLFSGACGSVLDDWRRGEAGLPPSFTRLLRPCQDDGRLERFSSWCIHRCGYSAEDLQAVLEVSGAIESADVFGCDRTELARVFSQLEEVQDGRTRTLWQYLDDLISLDEVVEAGGNAVRYVAAKSADPWLLHAPEALRMKSRAIQPHQVLPRKRTKESMGEEDEREMQAPSVPKRPALEGDVQEVTKAQLEGEERRPPEENTATTTSSSAPQSASPGDHPAQPADSRSEDKSCFASKVDDSVSAPSRPEDIGGSVLDNVSFVSRPWRIVDGSLNKPVCKGMLEALLFHIMTKPGIPEPVLMEHYRGVLQPVVLLDLLQALEGMGCVHKRYMVGQPRASLFSTAEVAKVRDTVRVSENGTPFYEPSVDCCLRLGKVFPHEANWNKWVQFSHS